MNKRIFSLIIGTIVALSSCSQSDELPTLPQGGEQSTTFTVEAPPSTRATVTGLTRYIVEAYEGKNLTATPVRVESANGTLTLVLKKETDYTFLFWADKGIAATETVASSGYWNTADLKAVAVTDVKKNDIGEAAYCLTVSFNSEDFETNKAVVLKNATAQVNFVEAAGLTAENNTLVVKYAAGTTLNVATGKVTEVAGKVTHTFTDIAKAAANVPLATDYVLAPQGEQNVVNLKAQFNAEPEKAIDNVPFQQNYRTNIKGEYSNLYTSVFTISNEVDDYTEEDFSPEPANVFSDNTEAEAPAKGDGTQENPYLIESGANIKWMQENAVGFKNKDKYYKLETDIEVTAATWKPIGSNNNDDFYGNFDGNNHTITGTLTAPADYGTYNFGFFSRIALHGSVSNLTNSAEVKAPNVIYVGGVAGSIVGKEGQTDIQNCHNTAPITGKYAVGGVLGDFYTAIESTTGTATFIQNCSNSGNIVALEKMPSGMEGNISSAGGIVGQLLLHPGALTGSDYIFVISNCTNSGSVSAPNGGTYVGGIIGTPKTVCGTCKVKGCTNTGIIKAGDITATEDLGTTDNNFLGKIAGGKYTGYSAGTIVIEPNN